MDSCQIGGHCYPTDTTSGTDRLTPAAAQRLLRQFQQTMAQAQLLEQLLSEASGPETERGREISRRAESVSLLIRDLLSTRSQAGR